MPFIPQTQQWPGRDAVLLVHGIGREDQAAQSEAQLALRTALGDAVDQFAIYELHYDGINDWFAEKTQLAAGVARLLGFLKAKFGGDDLADTVAAFAGDVIWPVLSVSARAALKEAFVVQLNKMVQDGPHGAMQRISVVCHSMGCFHTYEALHTAVDDMSSFIGPHSGVFLQNVVFMASPVQLIRTAIRDLGALVPTRTTLASSRVLRKPVADLNGVSEPYVREKWATITGELDPVGGFLFRQKLDWAYMNVPDQLPFIDDQSALNIQTRAELRDALQNALSSHSRPAITPENPHSWTAYIERHAEHLREWLVV